MISPDEKEELFDTKQITVDDVKRVLEAGTILFSVLTDDEIYELVEKQKREQPDVDNR